MPSTETMFGTPTINGEEENCPECGDTHLLRERERGEIVCTSCGLIVAQIIDASALRPPSISFASSAFPKASVALQLSAIIFA